MLFYTPPSPKVQLAPISYGVAESLVLDRFDSIAHGHYLRLSASFDWDFETIKKYVPADAVTLRCTPSHIELVSETDYLNLFDASHDGKLAQQDANRLCAVVLQRLNALQAKG